MAKEAQDLSVKILAQSDKEGHFRIEVVGADVMVQAGLLTVMETLAREMNTTLESYLENLLSICRFQQQHENLEEEFPNLHETVERVLDELDEVFNKKGK